MNENMNEIYQNGILPSVSLTQPEDAAPLARALKKGGIQTAEVSFRTSSDADYLSAMREACPDMLLGAGSISSVREAQAAVDAEARFLVLSGIQKELIDFANDHRIPVIPSVSENSDMEEAMRLGLNLIKWYPAEHLGGIRRIETLSSKYPDLQFIPAGIDPNKLGEYMRKPNVFAVSGSWMIDPEAMATRNYARIEESSRQAVQKMLDVHLAHVGMDGDQNAQTDAKELADLFFSSVRETPISYFGSPYAEVMKPDHSVGGRMHIAVGVSNTERAMHYYSSLGYSFDTSTIRRNDRNQITLIYFEKPAAGCRIHLIND